MNCGRLRSKNGVCLFRPTPFATHSSVITRTQNLSLKCNFIFVLIIMLSFLNNHIFCSEGVFLLVTEKSLGTKKTNQYSCLKHLTMSIQRIETSPLPFPRKNHLLSPPTMFLWNIHIWVSDGGERCHWKNEAIQSCRPRFPRNHQLEHLWRLLWSLCSALRTSLNASWLSLLGQRGGFLGRESKGGNMWPDPVCQTLFG